MCIYIFGLRSSCNNKNTFESTKFQLKSVSLHDKKTLITLFVMIDDVNV